MKIIEIIDTDYNLSTNEYQYLRDKILVKTVD